MKIKTQDLTGAALDWAVAKCNGKTLHYFVDDPLKKDPWLLVNGDVDQPLHSYTPSTDWAQGGPIIEREKMGVFPTHDGWAAGMQSGPTPLIAAMRCYVASKLGDEVEIPNNVMEGTK